MLVLQILCLRNTFIQCTETYIARASETYIFRTQIHLHTYTINAVPFNYLWYGAIYKWQYTDKTLTLRKCMYMRTSGASELRNFSIFTFLKLLFLSIFCRYIRYFVGTNDMLVGLHVPTNFQMYRQIFKCTDKTPKKHYWGGGGGAVAPPPPSGYANDGQGARIKEQEIWVSTLYYSLWYSTSFNYVNNHILVSFTIRAGIYLLWKMLWKFELTTKRLPWHLLLNCIPNCNTLSTKCFKRQIYWCSFKNAMLRHLSICFICFHLNRYI